MAEERTRATADDLVVVRWYTRARKFPQLVGKTPDGARIWGGPYTLTQLGGGFTVFLCGYWTMGLWGQFGVIINSIFLGAAIIISVIMLGRIPVGSRNPLAVAAGTCRAIAAPATGRLSGRPVRVRRPHTLRHRVVVALEDLPVLPAVLEATEFEDLTPAPAPVPTAVPETPKPALTGLQALLASHGIHNDQENP